MEVLLGQRTVVFVAVLYEIPFTVLPNFWGRNTGDSARALATRTAAISTISVKCFFIDFFIIDLWYLLYPTPHSQDEEPKEQTIVLPCSRKGAMVGCSREPLQR